VADNRNRLKLKFSRLGEEEAEVRFALTALVVTIAIRFALTGVVAAAGVSLLRVFLP
jgi:hypothetical protein